MSIKSLYRGVTLIPLTLSLEQSEIQYWNWDDRSPISCRNSNSQRESLTSHAVKPSCLTRGFTNTRDLNPDQWNGIYRCSFHEGYVDFTLWALASNLGCRRHCVSYNRPLSDILLAMVVQCLSVQLVKGGSNPYCWVLHPWRSEGSS
jgi:hypothetical protein